MMFLKKIGLVLGSLLLFSTSAMADCTGQFSAGQTCGNAGASNAPPSAGLLSPLLDRNFGAPSPQGTILNRGATLWSATRAPVLGNPGTNTGTLGFGSASGGTATITPPAIAGNTAVQLPTLAGTIPTTATTPLVLNATTGALTCPTCVTGTTGALTAGVTTTSGFSAGQILYSDGTLLQAAGAVKATSIALGGATIGTDGLGVTGTATISSTVTAGNFVPTANVIPTDGMYLNAVGQTAFAAGGVRIFFFNSTGLLMANASGATLTSSAATATAPTVVPRRSDSGSGLGSSGTGSISLIATSIEQLRINNGSIYIGGAATGADTAAIAPTISAALSSGNATNPDLVLQTGVLTTSGSGQATATTGLTIKGETQALLAPASLTIRNATAIPAGGTAGAGYLFSSTSNFGTFFGSGAPTLSAAQGSLYLRSDGAAGTRTYVNTNGTTGWAAFADTTSINLVVGSTTIGSGTTTRILYDNAGVLGEYTLTGSGTVVAMQTAPTFVTNITTPIVNLSGTSNQLVFQSAGVTGTLSWSPASTNKTITLPNGTTDFTATGGAGQVLRQSSAGAAITVATLACSDLSTATTACSTAIGTSGATIPLLNNNNTYSGSANFTSTFQINGNTMTFPAAAATIPRVVANGAKTLNTTAVASATCSPEQTDTATGTLTTDGVEFNFNGDPTAVTGYVPLTTGMLVIIPYPKVDAVAFRVCNNSSASITPGAVTINWKVIR